MVTEDEMPPRSGNGIEAIREDVVVRHPDLLSLSCWSPYMGIMRTIPRAAYDGIDCPPTAVPLFFVRQSPRSIYLVRIEKIQPSLLRNGNDRVVHTR